MLHCLVILDENGSRLNETLELASNAMSKLVGIKPTSQLLYPNTAIVLWGSDRQVEARPIVTPQDWRLGLGNWVGPPEPPGLDTLVQNCSRSLSDTYDGAFCFIAGELHRPEARIIVDSLGRMHVYFAKPHQEAIWLSNSALLLGALTRADWEVDSVREFLSKGTVFETRSLFRGVEKLSPDTLYTMGPSHVSTQTFPPPWSELEGSQENFLNNYSEAIHLSLERTLDTANRPVIDLTGGFDSRFILAALMDMRPPEDIASVVVGTNDNPDVIAANRIARHFALHHIHIKPLMDAETQWGLAKQALPLVDGEYDVLEYANILAVHRRLAQEFDASINGSGGDLTRDNWRRIFAPRFGPIYDWDNRRMAARRFAADTWAEKSLAHSFEDSLVEHFAKVIANTIGHFGEACSTRYVDEVYLFMRIQRWQGRLTSATSHIWPTFSPLLMRRPLEIVLSAPFTLRRNGRMAKCLLTRLNMPLADLPMADGAPAAPLTWQNWYRYLPRYRAHFMQKAFALRSRLPSFGETIKATAPALMKVAVDGCIMEPCEMLTAGLYKREALHALNQALRKGNIAPQHLGRFITLELTARTLKEMQN